MIMDPFITAAAVAGGSTLLSGIIGSRSQSSANKSYLQGVRETNQANKELYEQQVRDNRTNWAMENAYNTPSAQIARLRQAGINASDMVSNGNGITVQSSTAAPMQAPAQTPAVNYASGLGSAVKDAMSAYQQSQQMQESKYTLYKSGIEAQFYLRSQLNQIRLQEAEILAKETLTAQDFEKLHQLRIDSKYYEDNLKRQMSINDETWKNLQKSGREIDARVAREDSVAIATMQHMKVQEAVDWYNARTGRKVAENDAKRIGNDFGLGIVNLYHDWQKHQWNKSVQEAAQKLAKDYYSLNSSQQVLARAIMAAQLKNLDLNNEKLQQLMNSPFGNIVRDVLGLDPSVIGSAAVGAGAAMMLK